MEIDRWVVPPAVAAALFALAAIAPPVTRGDLVEAMRVEVAEPLRAGGMLLTRVALQRADDDALRAPRDVTVTTRDASGRALGSDRPRATRGVAYVSSRMSPGNGPRVLLHIEAEGRSANVSLPVAPPAIERDAIAAVEEVDIAASGGVLLPEVRGEVLVRVPGATELRIEPELEGVTIEPTVATPGSCDVAAFQVAVEGLGAPVAVVARMRDGSTKRWNRRLPLRAGGLSLTHERDHVVVQGTLSGQLVHLAGGDGAALRWWTTVTLDHVNDIGEASVRLPSDVRWVRGSFDARFSDDQEPVARWDRPSESCATDDTSRRWFEVRAIPPVKPEARLVFDGAGRARQTLAARVSRARGFALACLAASIAIESVLVLGFGLRRDVDEPGEVMRTRRERLAPLLAGVALLLLVGFALGLASITGARSP